MADRSERIMVTGACGRKGSEVTMALRERVGAENVVAVGHKGEPSSTLLEGGPYEAVDVCDFQALDRLVVERGVDVIYHLSGICAAAEEREPRLTWNANVKGLLNVLEVARVRGLSRVFVESPDFDAGSGVPASRSFDASNEPLTMSGIAALVGRALGRHYARAYGLDVRGLHSSGDDASEAEPIGLHCGS